MSAWEAISCLKSMGHHFNGEFLSQEFTYWCGFGDFHSMWPTDAIWWHRFGSTLGHVMACCLTASSHYQHHSWLIIKGILWHSPEGNFKKCLWKYPCWEISLLKLLPYLIQSSEFKKGSKLWHQNVLNHTNFSLNVRILYVEIQCICLYEVW